LCLTPDIIYLIQVCEIGKAYFKDTLSTTFNDPRLKLFYDDAARYLREEGNSEKIEDRKHYSV
jgi:predicted membrane-bound spermidine synthase